MISSFLLSATSHRVTKGECLLREALSIRPSVYAYGLRTSWDEVSARERNGRECRSHPFAKNAKGWGTQISAIGQGKQIPRSPRRPRGEKPVAGGQWLVARKVKRPTPPKPGGMGHPESSWSQHERPTQSKNGIVWGTRCWAATGDLRCERGPFGFAQGRLFDSDGDGSPRPRSG